MSHLFPNPTSGFPHPVAVKGAERLDGIRVIEIAPRGARSSLCKALELVPCQIPHHTLERFEDALYVLKLGAFGQRPNLL